MKWRGDVAIGYVDRVRLRNAGNPACPNSLGVALSAAFDLVDFWLQHPSVTVPEPTARHLQTMRDLVSPLGTGGNLN
jgi:hypothetical protein